jgi:capsid portal protein
MGMFRFVYALPLIINAGCALQHQVTFDNPERYTIQTPRQPREVVVVIDANTRARKVAINAAMTGAANNWIVEPGDMLKQVAEIELPQMFARYELSDVYKEPTNNGVTLELGVSNYTFDSFRAKISVLATAYGTGKQELLRTRYYAEGESQGGLMFLGGAFGMKSAIRQSSLDAYKKIFADIRTDLVRALDK